MTFSDLVLHLNPKFVQTLAFEVASADLKALLVSVLLPFYYCKQYMFLGQVGPLYNGSTHNAQQEYEFIATLLFISFFLSIDIESVH